MRIQSALLPIPLALLFQACSHIPTPYQVPDVEPYAIMQNIRCEIRRTIEEDYPGNARLRSATIGYGLTLKAEENATQSGSLGFIWPITHGSISLGPSAAANRQRYDEGITNLVEPVGNTENAPCISDEPLLAIKYPIIGEIGVRNIIHRFVELNSITPTSQKDGFIQTLKFRLKFSGGIKPSFAIIKDVNPTVSGMFELSADREDTHTLVIAMTPYKKAAADKIVQVEITNFEEIGKPGASPQDVGPPRVGSGPRTRRLQQRGPSASQGTRDVEQTLSTKQNQRQFEDFIDDRFNR